ncbi:Lipopolysaccharide biosynthesis protein WzxC [subsurface metagenome]
MSHSLKSRTVNALFWSFLERGGEQGIHFIVSIILARILFPEQFGLIAMLTIFIALARSLVDSGFGSALIQKKEITHEDKCSVFYFNIALGFVMAGLLCLAAPWIAAFYGVPHLTPLTRVLSIKMITSSFGIIHGTLLCKQLDFKTQLKVRLISTIISGAVGISMAYNGFGVWSLVAQQLTSSVVHTLFLWILCSWRPSLTFSVAALRGMFGFGSKLLITSVIETFFKHIYLIVIGKIFPPAQLGYFSRARGIQQLPVSNLSMPVKRVMFPVFSTIQDDKKRLKQVVRKTMATLVLINFPIIIGLAIVAEPLVIVLLTEKWVPCIPYLRLLCVTGLMYPLHLINVNVLIAQGRSDLLLRVHIVKKILIVIAIAITYRWGIKALIYGQIAQSLIAYYLNTYYTGKILRYSFLEQVADVIPYLAVASLMGAGVYAIQLAPIESPLIQLTAQVATGILIWTTLCYLFRLAAFKEAVSTVKPYLMRLAVGQPSI